MARRKTLWTPELVRQRIKTTQLLKRLQDHALGVEGVKMKPSQQKAAQFLISRVVGVPNEAQDLNVQGNMTYVFRNPTDRPPQMTNGHHRSHVDRSSES